jgi:hypothetical protein
MPAATRQPPPAKERAYQTSGLMPCCCPFSMYFAAVVLASVPAEFGHVQCLSVCNVQAMCIARLITLCTHQNPTVGYLCLSDAQLLDPLCFSRGGTAVWCCAIGMLGDTLLLLLLLLLPPPLLPPPLLLLPLLLVLLLLLLPLPLLLLPLLLLLMLHHATGEDRSQCADGNQGLHSNNTDNGAAQDKDEE